MHWSKPLRTTGDANGWAKAQILEVHFIATAVDQLQNSGQVPRRGGVREPMLICDDTSANIAGSSAPAPSKSSTFSTGIAIRPVRSAIVDGRTLMALTKFEFARN
jgi:hypothetical protein